jgi:cell wall-associated NlpC family hydrolase
VPQLRRHPWVVARAVAASAVAVALLGTGLTAPSAGDLQSQISAGQSAAGALRSQVAAETARIQTTGAGLSAAQARLGDLQSQLVIREAHLRSVQLALVAARDHLINLENELHMASDALAANLVARYEHGQPDLTTVVLEARGFRQLLDEFSFLRRISDKDAQIVAATRVARAAVSRQATMLGSLERRDRRLTVQVLAERNQVAALQAALLSSYIAQTRVHATDSARLQTLSARLRTLEARAAAQAAQAAVTGRVDVGGIAVNTAGMVQAPPGAPAAVAQVIAAGNAIATLPYIYGGGHASFHANGYDCSGSVSYALAAAGLVSSPMVSGDFEAWGDPGPGRWITVYANAGHVWMVVAGWRFDTVALAQSGTRWASSGGDSSGYVVRHPPGL